RLGVPTLIFVNKIDRAGAHDQTLMGRIAERLSPHIVAMGEVADLGLRRASVRPFGAGDATFAADLSERLAEGDDALLAAFVAGDAPPYAELRTALAAQTHACRMHPVFFGSAITGAGVPELQAGIAELLPSAQADPSAPLSGAVFKVERGAAG